MNLCYFKRWRTVQTVNMYLCLREGASVLIHGTEGADSTLQVTSLAQIILDPSCRTIKGFQGLLEREWLQVSFSELWCTVTLSLQKHLKLFRVFLFFRISPCNLCHLFAQISRQVTHFSSAAPSQLTLTASLAKRLLSSCSFWTVCGRSFASFPAPLNSMRASWCCSSNMPTLLSLVLSWATVQLRG